jgi:uncharacterized protein (DUF1778 family)
MDFVVAAAQEAAQKTVAEVEVLRRSSRRTADITRKLPRYPVVPLLSWGGLQWPEVIRASD